MVNAMSDPVTNAEVEDVLSSIRRLVSEDKRPLQGSNPAPAADRLVLTPALRVAKAEEKTPDTTQGTAGTDPQEYQTDGPAQDAAQMLRFGTQADDGDDPAQDYRSDPYNFDDDSDVEGESTPFPGAQEVSPEVHFDTGSDQSQSDGDDLATMLSQDQTATDGQGDPAFAEEPFSDEAPMMLNAEASDEMADNVEPLQPASKAAVLSAKIEELEAAIGNIADTWEPDGAGDDEYTGTEAPAMAWEDDTESREGAAAHLFADASDMEPARSNDFSKVASAFKSEPQETTEPVEQQPQGNAATDYALDEQLIDEEMLRDMVGEIVRSELQGALGERITRNVRKLVRREIHRALTAQDLE